MSKTVGNMAEKPENTQIEARQSVANLTGMYNKITQLTEQEMQG